jgi:hypothetical protein
LTLGNRNGSMTNGNETDGGLEMTIQTATQHSVQVAEMQAQEVDIELLTFMERYATNLAKWDLLIYFGHNPNIRDSAFNIASQIGRRVNVIEKELNDLVYLGILRARDQGHSTVFELARVPGTRRTVMRLAKRSQA